MLKLKKIFLLFIFYLIFLFISLKLADYLLKKKYGLGNPIIYEKSRLTGYNIQPNQEIIRRGQKIKINNRGMRSSRNWDNNSMKKIIFFGDSVTYGGSIISNKDLFSEQLCKNLNENKKNKFLCGNLGANGYNLYSIIRSIKYKNFDNEDLIIVTIIANNFSRMFHNPLSQPFWTKNIDNFFPALTEIFFIYLDQFRMSLKHDLNKEKILSEINKMYYNDLIDELENALYDTDKPYMILYSPSINELKNKENNQYFKNLLIKKFFNFYDLSEIEYKDKEELYYDEIHLNKKGHKIYSQYIYSLIQKKF